MKRPQEIRQHMNCKAQGNEEVKLGVSHGGQDRVNETHFRER
jgi:hypothetical protein